METTLRLSRNIGLGTGYADDFQRLTEMLGGLSGADSDKLTASLVEKLSKSRRTPCWRCAIKCRSCYSRFSLSRRSRNRPAIMKRCARGALMRVQLVELDLIRNKAVLPEMAGLKAGTVAPGGALRLSASGGKL
ncbi:hypothetical protein [Sorlinia euscelidii]|uniref:hypothetical protein n=1 Tax=Sorlinia euscelidii TaxID=3081148 RepID=UPI003AADF793